MIELGEKVPGLNDGARFRSGPHDPARNPGQDGYLCFRGDGPTVGRLDLNAVPDNFLDRHWNALCLSACP